MDCAKLEVFETEVDFVVIEVMNELVRGGLVRLDKVLVVRDKDFSEEKGDESLELEVLDLEDEELVGFEIVEKAELDEISLDDTELIDLDEVEDEDEEVEALRLDVKSAFFVEVEDDLEVIALGIATLDFVVVVLDFKLVEGGTAVELFDEMEDFIEVLDVVVEVF